MTDSLLREVEDYTRQMRAGATREMRDLRSAVVSRHIDVNRTVCASAYDDLLDRFICVLVLPTRDVIECSANYGQVGEEDVPPFDWHPAPTGYYHKWISAALHVLEAEQAEDGA